MGSLNEFIKNSLVNEAKDPMDIEVIMDWYSNTFKVKRELNNYFDAKFSNKEVESITECWDIFFAALEYCMDEDNEDEVDIIVSDIRDLADWYEDYNANLMDNCEDYDDEIVEWAYQSFPELWKWVFNVTWRK
jgi:hypothetical protein